MENYVQYIKKLFNDYLEIIPNIARQIYPNKIYIKIHPSENPLPWKNITKFNDNIIIQEDTSTLELINNAKLIIQSESTTSVESIINNKKVYSYIPESYKDSDIPLEIPKKISKTYHDQSLFVKKVIEEFTNNSQKDNKVSLNILKEYLNNLKENNVSGLIMNNLKNKF